MALRMIEGFELYGGQSTLPYDLNSYYSFSSSTSFNNPNATGRIHGYGLRMGVYSGSPDTFGTPAFSGTTTWIIGFGIKREEDYFYVDTFYPHSGTFFSGYNGGTRAFYFHHTGTDVQFKHGGTTSTLHTWTIPSVTQTWQHYEFKVVVNGASSSAEFRINGVSQGSSGTKTLAQSSCTRFQWDAFANTPAGDVPTTWLDDIYICDGTGSANNDFLGPCVVEGIRPNGAGTTTQWSRSSGAANYNAVDETTMNGDTDYVYNASTANIDTYACSNLSVINSTVFGVQSNIWTNAEDSSSGTMQAYNTYSAANQARGTWPFTYSGGTYFKSSVVAETADAAGSVPWTTTLVNAAEFGFKQAT